ncbi:hypothetical protein KC930_00890 [Candidatus Saccharibacteria bacterium]|nr:hypothetical protein [Candidatus Saccharibacteria bacterium]
MINKHNKAILASAIVLSVISIGLSAWLIKVWVNNGNSYDNTPFLSGDMSAVFYILIALCITSPIRMWLWYIFGGNKVLFWIVTSMDIIVVLSTFLLPLILLVILSIALTTLG